MKENSVTVQPPVGNDHLTLQEIAGFSAGGLGAAEGRRVWRHCQECAGCREELAVVRQSLQADDYPDSQPEFAALLKTGEQSARRVWRAAVMTGTGSATVPPPEQTSGRSRLAGWFTWSLRPVPATLAVLILLALSAWWLWPRPQSLERAMASLRNSWTVSRPIELRITGELPPLPYQPVRSVDRQDSPALPPTNRNELLTAEMELRCAVRDHDSPSARHALARLNLLKLELDEAEEHLRKILQAEPHNAAAHADLAVLYYQRGIRRGDRDPSVPDFGRAAEESERALALDPQLREALFNLALIHERMQLMDRARKDWERYLELDRTSPWAKEAEDRLRRLNRSSVLRSPQPEVLVKNLRAASAARDQAALRRLLEEDFSQVTELVADRFLDEHLSPTAAAADPAAAAGTRQLLQDLATLICKTKDDHYFIDLLRFVETSSPERLKQICAVRKKLKDARKYHLKGDYQRAVQAAGSAGDLAERIADDCHTEAAWAEMARIYVPQLENEHRELPRIRQQLLSASERRQHRQMQARALLALANQYLVAGLMSSFFDVSDRAEKIASRLGDFDLMAVGLSTLGAARANLGDREQGLREQFAAMRSLYEHPASLLRACQTYVHFAKSLADSGHDREALVYQLEALPFCRSCGPHLYLPALGRVGKYYALVGQMREALDYFDRALDGGAQSQVSLIDLYLSKGDALVRNRLFPEAEAAYRQAEAKLGQGLHPKYLAAIEHGLATALLPQGRIEEAELALQNSINFIERSRDSVNAASGRSQYVGSQLDVYRSMVEFLYVYKRSPEDAFNVTETYRNRELLDLIVHARSTRWEERRRDLKLEASTRSLTLREIQAKLPTNTQLIEYALTERRLLIWIIDRECWQHECVEVSPAQLQPMVAGYLAAVSGRQPLAVVNAQARTLYRQLIEPVARHLKPGQNLVLIPDGVLSSLPFGALVNPGSGLYLLEEYPLIIDPSATILVKMLARSQQSRPRPVRSLLAVSDPEFNPQVYPGLLPLAGAGEETRQSLSQYPVSKALSGAAATKVAFQQWAKRFDVLHLATHSVVSSEDPLLSAVVLAAAPSAPADQTESSLSAHEIFRLRLPHTRLVILSSCQSLVNYRSGQAGLGGLAHAFFSAGVPTVIGSLWKVDDRSTASLMAEFHRSWRNNSALSAGQALRQAQLASLHSATESWRHPYHWAAFHVSGDGITI